MFPDPGRTRSSAQSDPAVQKSDQPHRLSLTVASASRVLYTTNAHTDPPCTVTELPSSLDPAPQQFRRGNTISGSCSRARQLSVHAHRVSDEFPHCRSQATLFYLLPLRRESELASSQDFCGPPHQAQLLTAAAPPSTRCPNTSPPTPRASAQQPSRTRTHAKHVRNITLVRALPRHLPIHLCHFPRPTHGPVPRRRRRLRLVPHLKSPASDAIDAVTSWLGIEKERRRPKFSTVTGKAAKIPCKPS